MSLADYVTLSITQNSVGLTRAGFGTGLLLSYTAAWAERTRTYNQLSDVATDFASATGPEYLFAQAYFGQNPAPTALIIGRGANKPTKLVTISAVSPTTALTYKYQIKVKGDGVTSTTVEYTSDGTPTDAEWAAAMVTALNAVVGKNYTATGASSPITLTGTSGAWFSVEIVDVNHMTQTETTTDPGVTADLTAITAENPNWYGVATSFQSVLFGHSVAAYCEANGKIYIADSADTKTVTTAVTNGDLIDDLKTSAYARSLGFYHPNPAAFAGAALLGKCLPFDPGSETWAFKTLAGVPTYPMTATHRANIVARNGNGYESVYQLNMTFQGKTGDGGYLDTTRGLDWLRDDMSKAVFGALAGAAKIPYTDPGIAVIESQVRGSLKRAADRGILVLSSIVVTVPLAASVATIDKTSRTLNNVKFSATLQGAVHKINVQGVVSA